MRRWQETSACLRPLQELGGQFEHNAEVLKRACQHNCLWVSPAGGVSYFRPDGWIQVWITTVLDDDPDFSELRDWPIAYHGTERCYTTC